MRGGRDSGRPRNVVKEEPFNVLVSEHPLKRVGVDTKFMWMDGPNDELILV
jgi:hypothetical protein